MNLRSEIRIIFMTVVLVFIAAPLQWAFATDDFNLSPQNSSLFSKLKSLPEDTRGKLRGDEYQEPMVMIQDTPEFWNTYRIGADLSLELIDAKIKSGELSPVVLGFLDGGFDTSHPLFKDRFVFALQKGDPKFDDSFHGTHVLGTAACNGPFSVGNKCPFEFSVATYNQVCEKDEDSKPLTYQDSLVRNLAQVIKNKFPRIISASLKFGEDASFLEAIKRLNGGAKGALFVNAVGNEYSDLNEDHHALIENGEVILVGSINESGLKSDFSNTVKSLFVVAPGENIFSLGTTHAPDADSIQRIHRIKSKDFNGHKLFSISGTSMATPHVSGILGVLLSINPELSNDDLKKIVEKTSIDLGKTGRDESYGHGLLNSYGATQLADLLRNHSWAEALAELKSRSDKEYSEAIDMINSLEVASPSLEDLQKAWKKIRKAYYLDPNNKHKIDALYAIERFVGYQGEAAHLALRSTSLSGNSQYVYDFDGAGTHTLYYEMRQVAEELKRDDLKPDLEGDFITEKISFKDALDQAKTVYDQAKKVEIESKLLEREGFFGTRSPASDLEKKLQDLIKTPEDFVLLANFYMNSNSDQDRDLAWGILSGFFTGTVIDSKKEHSRIESFITPQTKPVIRDLVVRLLDQFESGEVSEHYPRWVTSHSLSTLVVPLEIPIERIKKFAQSSDSMLSEYGIKALEAADPQTAVENHRKMQLERIGDLESRLLSSSAAIGGWISISNFVMDEEFGLRGSHHSLTPEIVDMIRKTSSDTAKKLWEALSFEDREKWVLNSYGNMLSYAAIVGIPEARQKVIEYIKDSEDESQLHRKKWAWSLIPGLSLSKDELIELAKSGQAKKDQRFQKLIVHSANFGFSEGRFTGAEFVEIMSAVAQEWTDKHGEFFPPTLSWESSVDLDYRSISIDDRPTLSILMKEIVRLDQDPNHRDDVHVLADVFFKSQFGDIRNHGLKEENLPPPKVPLVEEFENFRPLLTASHRGIYIESGKQFAREARRDPNVADAFFKHLDGIDLSQHWREFNPPKDEDENEKEEDSESFEGIGLFDELERMENDRQIRSPLLTAVQVDPQRGWKLFDKFLKKRSDISPDSIARFFIDWGHAELFRKNTDEEILEYNKRAVDLIPNIENPLVKARLIASTYQDNYTGEQKSTVRQSLVELFVKAEDSLLLRQLTSSIEARGDEKMLESLKSLSTNGWAVEKVDKLNGLMRQIEENLKREVAKEKKS